MKSTYIVSGMTCGHCVRHVTEEVQAVTGVEQVEVQLDGGRMMVTSSEPIPFETIAEAIAEAGDYTVTAA